MRNVIGVAALLLLAGPALAQGVEVFPGQTITAAIERTGETKVARLSLVEGETLSLKLAVTKGSGLYMETAMFDPSGAYVSIDPHIGTKISATVPIDMTGVWYLSVWGQGGTTGEFTLATKLKAAKPAGPTFSVPAGTVQVDLRKGSIVKCSAKADAAGLDLGIDAVESPGGQNVLDPGTVSESGGSVSFATVPLPYTGTYTFRYAARNSGSGTATMKVSAKAPKVANAKPPPGALYESMVVKIKGDDVDKLEATVSGGAVESAVLLTNGQGPGAALLHHMGEDDVLLYNTPADSAPDGWYVLRVTLTGGAVVDHCFFLGLDYPEAPVVTGQDGTYLHWTAPTAWQVFHIEVECPITEGPLYTFLQSGPQRSVNIPTGLFAPDWPYEASVSALGAGNKMAVGTWEQAPGVDVLHGAAAAGDLVTLTILTSSGEFDYVTVEPAGGTEHGFFVQKNDFGRFAFDVEGTSMSAFALPGALVVGQAPDGPFCATPAPAGDYDLDSVAATYNVILNRTDGGARRTDFGELFVDSTGSWTLWLGAGRALEATGSYDQAGGVVHLNAGPNRFANATFSWAGSYRVAVLDVTGEVGDPGMGVGLQRVALSWPYYAGDYAGLTSDSVDPERLRLANGTITFEDGLSIKLKLDTPWEGFALGGSTTDGGILMVTPDGPLVIGGWGEEDWISVLFRR